MRPTPDPVDPEKLTELTHAVIKAAKFPMLATVDPEGQPRVRPVSPVRVDADFTIYVANLRAYQKTSEIAANSKVELAYLAPDHDQVRITGEAVVLEDGDIIQAIWDANPLLRRYLGDVDNPDLIIYQVQPHAVRFMREWALEYFDVV